MTERNTVGWWGGWWGGAVHLCQPLMETVIINEPGNKLTNAQAGRVTTPTTGRVSLNATLKPHNSPPGSASGRDITSASMHPVAPGTGGALLFLRTSTVTSTYQLMSETTAALSDLRPAPEEHLTPSSTPRRRAQTSRSIFWLPVGSCDNNMRFIFNVNNILWSEDSFVSFTVNIALQSYAWYGTTRARALRVQRAALVYGSKKRST